MLSGLKFIPRDQLDKASDEDINDSRRWERKRKGKDRTKKRSSRYESSDEDDLGKIKKNSRKKKWYSSNEESVLISESGSESDSGSDEKSRKHRKREKKSHRSNSKGKAKDKSREKRSKRTDYSPGEYSESNYEHERGSKTNYGRNSGERDDEEGSNSKSNIVRKELGLDWMLRSKENVERKTETLNDQLVEPKVEEIKKENPRELNPYFKNSGTGYPEEADENKTQRDKSVSAVVGDGGASWRLKALKRAQEQAAREGRNINEVVEERWGSVGQLSVSLASRRAAPSRAHLHAIKNRQKGAAEDEQTVDVNNEKVSEKKNSGGSRYDVSRRHPEAKVPKVHGSLSWGKRKRQTMTSKDSGLLSAAISSINKFTNDGSFMSQITREQYNDPIRSSYDGDKSNVELELATSEPQLPGNSSVVLFEGLSANQLAAKALQLRLKGSHEGANQLMKEVENMKAKQVAEGESNRLQRESQPRRYSTHETAIRQRRSEDDGDAHLAQKIVQNKKYSISTQADAEYDYDEGPRKKSRKKNGNDIRSIEKDNFPNRMMTQQERCKFCFENPNRPKHLVIAIANFSYLSLPHWQSIVPGHCCILTLQHESATRAVDNNVWDEIRNFKKCLIMMFAKQEMELVFLETVMGLAQQKRHCMVEVIPLPHATAKAAPLYFKKAIDEAEDEWSQHNAKKLIDTSGKGLRGSIPKDFPYFHVEFGLNRGFVHVIDDETSFKSNFGINVIRGMLQLPEDMYGRTKRDSVESQKQAVANFMKDWEPFDWTKQLE